MYIYIYIIYIYIIYIYNIIYIYIIYIHVDFKWFGMIVVTLVTILVQRTSRTSYPSTYLSCIGSFLGWFLCGQNNHKPAPSHHHFYRWDCNHSQSWVIYGMVLRIHDFALSSATYPCQAAVHIFRVAAKNLAALVGHIIYSGFCVVILPNFGCLSGIINHCNFRKGDDKNGLPEDYRTPSKCT